MSAWRCSWCGLVVEEPEPEPGDPMPTVCSRCATSLLVLDVEPPA